MTTSTKLNLLAPASGSQLSGPADLCFIWNSVNGELRNYMLFIANSPRITPSSVIWEKNPGSCTQAIPMDFTPEKGKTYYWAVRGETPEGEIVWSRTQSFTMKADEITSGSATGFNVALYPNPVKNEPLIVVVDVPAPGPVNITISDVNGRRLFVTEELVMNTGLRTFNLPSIQINPGVYLVEVGSSGMRTVKKLILVK